MKKLQITIINLIIYLKVIANGFGFFDISLWFYLILLSFFLTFISLINNSAAFLKTYIKYLITLILISFLMLLVFIFNGLFSSSIMGWLRFFIMILFSITVYANINTTRDIMKIMMNTIIGVSISSFFGIIQYLNTNIYEYILSIFSFLNSSTYLTGRISGLSSTTITFSYELIIAILFSIFMFKKSRNKLIIPLMMLLLIALIINQTRSAIIAVIISLIYLLIRNKNRKSIFKYTFVSMFIILISFLIFRVFSLESRFFNDDISSSSRIPMIVTAVRYSLIYPFGTGEYNLINSGIDLSMYSSQISNTIINNYTHNQFSNFLVEFGFLGLGLMVYIYYLVLFHYKKNKNKNLMFVILFLTLISYTINAMTHNGGIMHAEPLIWLVFSIFFKIPLLNNGDPK